MKALIFGIVALSSAILFANEEKIELFNGKDLSGWTSVIDYDVTIKEFGEIPTWSVTNGAIRTTGTPFGYLRTKRSDFENFTIELEYRWWGQTERPNSGVFFRLKKETGTFIPRCYENQLCRGMACDLVALAGMPIEKISPRSPYDATKPLSGISVSPKTVSDSEHPFGSWNSLSITVKGDEFISVLNGVEQNHVKGIEKGAGAIALQSEGGAVEFRRIFIYPSKKK